MEKLKRILKPRLQLMVISALFLMGTTFVSLILLCVPTWISPDISLKEIKWGSAILGSIFGQFTLLIALSLTKNRSMKDILKRIEDIETEN